MSRCLVGKRAIKKRERMEQREPGANDRWRSRRMKQGPLGAPALAALTGADAVIRKGERRQNLKKNDYFTGVLPDGRNGHGRDTGRT